MLIHLNTRPNGEALVALKGFYNEGKRSHPALYQNYSFDAYLVFLESYNLIERDTVAAVITDIGREFLKYMVDTRRSPALG